MLHATTQRNIASKWKNVRSLVFHKKSFLYASIWPHKWRRGSFFWVYLGYLQYLKCMRSSAVNSKWKCRDLLKRIINFSSPSYLFFHLVIPEEFRNGDMRTLEYIFSWYWEFWEFRIVSACCNACLEFFPLSSQTLL